MPAKLAPCRFCQALAEETRHDPLRWATIDAVAKRLGIASGVAILLAGECAAAGHVRLDIKGPPYRRLPGAALLTEEGRQLIRSKGAPGRARRSGKARHG